jgi:hypothetical protein
MCSAQTVIENIEDEELIECIEVVDDELKSLLNKTPGLAEIAIEAYRPTEEDGSVIQICFSHPDKEAAINRDPDFFEDYCFCNRKERDELLHDLIAEMKAELEN